MELVSGNCFWYLMSFVIGVKQLKVVNQWLFFVDGIRICYYIVGVFQVWISGVLGVLIVVWVDWYIVYWMCWWKVVCYNYWGSYFLFVSILRYLCFWVIDMKLVDDFGINLIRSDFDGLILNNIV